MTFSETGQFGACMGDVEGFEPSESAQMNISDLERVLSLSAGAGLIAFGLARIRLSGLVLGALGAGLLYRGLKGRCQCYAALGIDTADHSTPIGVPARHGYKVERTIVVDRPVDELYRFWRQLDNLPTVMRHLKSVESIDHEHSHWVADGAFGKDVEWDAAIVNERENELIAWRSLPGGDVDTAGSIHFRQLGQNGRTEVTLSMKYSPPGGKLGAHVASLFGEGMEQKLDDDLESFKQVMETGMHPSPDVSYP